MCNTKTDKWQPDAYGKLNTWGHRWEPRSKTVAALCFITGVIFLESLVLVVAAFFLTFMAALSMQLPLRYLLIRLALGTPFIALMAVTLALGGGLPPTADRLIFAGLVSFKALTSILTMVILLGTQPLKKYLDGLAGLGMPSVIVSALFLSYRYVFLFKDQIVNTQRSLASRAFQPGAGKRKLMTYGEMAGGMLLKAMDRSDAVYQAMASRGFDGHLRPGKPAAITKNDLTKCTLVLAVAAALVVLEWRGALL